jgi:predicted N-acetyltransferase YhbS
MDGNDDILIRAFMALELAPGGLDGVEGVIVYPSAFDKVS